MLHTVSHDCQAPFPMLTALIIKELGSLPRELQCRHLKLLHINHIDGHQHITELPEFGNLLDLTHLQVVHSSTAAIPSSYLVSNKLVNIYFCLSHRDCKPDVKHNQVTCNVHLHCLRLWKVCICYLHALVPAKMPVCTRFWHCSGPKHHHKRITRVCGVGADLVQNRRD